MNFQYLYSYSVDFYSYFLGHQYFLYKLNIQSVYLLVFKQMRKTRRIPELKISNLGEYAQ
jgi:hypothetical protein